MNEKKRVRKSDPTRRTLSVPWEWADKLTEITSVTLRSQAAEMRIMIDKRAEELGLLPITPIRTTKNPGVRITED